MPLIYADVDDLAAYPGAPAPLPDNTEALLRVASRQVRHATRAALYSTDDDGYPRDENLRETLREAVCAQVVTWLELGITPTSGLQTTAGVRVKSKAQGGRSVTYADDDQATVARRAAIAAGIAPGTEAYLLLADSGLLSWGAWTS